MAVRKKVDIEEVQKKFFAQVQDEYDRFRYGQMKAGIDNVFKNSLKITFYPRRWSPAARAKPPSPLSPPDSATAPSSGPMTSSLPSPVSPIP